MNTLIKYLFLSFFAISVTACSSEGGGGNDPVVAARINPDNAEQLGTAAAEAAKQAVLKDSTSVLGFRPGTDSGIGTISNELSKSFAARVAQMPLPGVDCGLAGGSADEVINPDGSSTVTFIDCDLFGLGLLVFNGVVNATTTITASTITIDLEYINFTVDDGVDIETLDMQVSCTTDNNTLQTSCTFPDVVGFDGRTYQFSDVSITGNELSGYNVAASIVDPDHGSFFVVTTIPILFACTNGQPSSGQIQFTDGAGVLVTATFNDCTSFTVSYSGTSEIYLW